MKPLFTALLTVAMTPAFSATEAELTGRWVHIKYPSMRVEITQNGSNYVVADFSDRKQSKYAARYVNGMLTINAGPCALQADVERKTGNLLFSGKEYRRLKAGESFEASKGEMPKW